MDKKDGLVIATHATLTSPGYQRGDDMIRRHDRWSKLGEENLGEMNIRWAKRAGPMTLMKAIMNDHWADAPKQDWPKEHVDFVMSKLYWCWVAWLDQTHPEGA
jgi:hypothetical protein